jgi:hypothetical protein
MNFFLCVFSTFFSPAMKCKWCRFYFENAAGVTGELLSPPHALAAQWLMYVMRVMPQQMRHKNRAPENQEDVKEKDIGDQELHDERARNRLPAFIADEGFKFFGIPG